MIYKSSIGNNDDIPFQCVFSYIDKYVEFIDEEKMIIYKQNNSGVFKVYIGTVENNAQKATNNLSNQQDYEELNILVGQHTHAAIENIMIALVLESLVLS